MSVIQGNAIESGLAAYEIPNSLKFNSADSAYLSWTPASAGNRKTWTFSAWVKRSSTGARQFLFSTGTSGSNYGHFMIDSDDKLYYVQEAATLYRIGSNQLLRDFGAWYHIVFTMDTTNATSNDRMRYYVNGVRTDVGVFNTQPPQNTDMIFNQAAAHSIGRNHYAASDYAGYYLSEVNFIDGQALDPTSFGEYNSETGVWQPIAYAGTYGTNGFYLPMTQDQIVEGFNTVLFRGNASLNKVTGAGLSPDLVWIKDRFFGSGSDHFLFDSLRGTKSLSSNTTGAETEKSSDGFTSLDADGFTLNGSGGGDNVNRSGSQMVAWCWDAGNSTVSNTDGTITSSVRASQTYGFSVVTYTGTGANATVGHGLGTAPGFIIVKRRNSPADWMCYHTGIGNNNHLILDTTAAAAAGAGAWNATSPTSSVFSIGTYGEVNVNTGTYVAYCFAETGYSKFGSYTGNGSSSGPTVTLGWKPAFIMIKNTSGTGGWVMLDTTRSTDGGGWYLYANSSAADSGPGSNVLTVTDTGFTITNSWTDVNSSGSTYIYAAFKDQREAAFWRDFSGNGNHWQPNNLDFNDSVVDVPTNYGTDTGVGAEVRGNYATWNALDRNSSGSLTNGNLNWTSGTTAHYGVRGTISPPSGKWYFEVTASAATSGSIAYGIGMANAANPLNQGAQGNTGAYIVYGVGSSMELEAAGVQGSTISGASIAAGDVIQVAYDVDASKMWVGKNNTWYNSSGGTTGNPAAGTNPSFSSLLANLFPFVEVYNSTVYANFGQLPFAYTAPSGFKALCTQNLPEPTVVDGGDYFDVSLYAGTDTTNNITGLAYQPDWVWIKNRTSVQNHLLVDVVRGSNKSLQSSTTNAEGTITDGRFTSFNSNGFTVASSDLATNASSNNYVAWSWKAGGTGVSNTDGSITSTVSANTTAGFSIVTYTGNGTADATVGHGLGVVPSFFVVKNRVDGTTNWNCYHKSLGKDLVLQLSTTSAQIGVSNYWGTTGPTSTTIQLLNDGNINASGQGCVCYAFAPVEGYSAFGSYTGNGSSTDGVFVYTGFKPAFVLAKANKNGYIWTMSDSTRDTYNVVTKHLQPHSSAAEGSSFTPYDFTSNGFKLRTSDGAWNENGTSYVYMAFAENPFKYSLAR